MTVLNSLAPVFLLIALGVWLQRSGLVSPGFLRESNRVTYWLALPALVFTQLVKAFHDVGGARTALGAMALATLLVIALAYGVAWALRLPGGGMGTFVQSAFRGNLAFVGLPVIFSLPEVAVGGLSSRTVAVVVIGPMMVAYNFVAVVALMLGQHSFGWSMLRPLLSKLATTPPLVALVAGIIVAAAGWSLPTTLDTTLGALGAMAMPLGLLGVGGALVAVDHRAGGRESWLAAGLKTAVSPLLGWLVGRALGLGEAELRIVTLFMATPTAVVSYAVAVELQGDEAMAASAIVRSTLLSLVTMAVVLTVL